MLLLKRISGKLIKPLDPVLLSLCLILVVVGLIVLYSASGRDEVKMLTQGRNLLLAFAALWLFAVTPPHVLEKLAIPLYLFTLVLLLLVPIIGEVSHGAKRWLHLGPIHLQPSEFMKIVLPLALASYFERRGSALRSWDYGVALLFMVIPTALVVKQPDLGTALLIATSGIYILFFAGLSWKMILMGLTLLGAISPVVWQRMHDYQKKRILTFLDPSQDPLGAGYHTLQAMIAVGSGGIWGRGWLQGTQSHLDFLPEHSTDFIFAVFGEEFGLWGELIFLGLMLMLIARGLKIAYDGSTTFTRLMASGLSMTLFTYMFVNMGMVTGILPVVGVPLPFMSYGGTSLLTIFVSVGIIMSVRRHRKLVRQ
jgi:rod shape determining protein RodA